MKYRYNVDLEVDRLMHSSCISKDKTSVYDHMRKREFSILSNNEIVEKYYQGKIECVKLDIPACHMGKFFSHIFIYHDESGLSPESSFHFYTENGELLWTWPWNGAVQEYNVLKCPFNEAVKKIDYVAIEVLDNNIKIFEYSKNLAFNGMKFEGASEGVFDIDGFKISQEEVSHARRKDEIKQK